MINRIYSAVVAGHSSTSDWYYKKHSACKLTDKGKKLQDMLISNIPDSHIGLLGCVVSWMSFYTVFSDIVEQLDPENTYASPESHNGMTIWQHIAPVEQLRRCIQLLDTDLTDRLSAPTWFDLATAICIQILRESDAN